MLLAILLGLVQGLTEFLPVSSSGHLVIVPYLLSAPQPPLSFDVALHAGTLLAVLAYFRSDLWYLATRTVGIGPDGEPAHARRTVLLLAIGSVPAGLAGLLLASTFERFFGEPRTAALFLLVTGAILYLAEHVRRRRVGARLGVSSRALSPEQAAGDPGRHEGTISPLDSLIIGCAQALAILPGISRSGATIAAGMLRGISRQGAARFSFLLSIPVVAGASVLEVPALFAAADTTGQFTDLEIVVGMIVAAASGYWAIRYLLRLVVTDDLTGFARYVILFGLLTLVGTLWLGPPSG